MNKSLFTAHRLAFAILSLGLITGCSTSTVGDPLDTIPSKSSNSNDVEPDWDAVGEALEQYPFTPFTLALVGEAQRPEEGFIVGETAATDIAYCRNFARKGMQSRIGSDFWKQSLEYDRKLVSRLKELVSDPEHVEWLTWQAEGMYAEAINFARKGDAAAAMNFNFGGHSKACSEFAAKLPS